MNARPLLLACLVGAVGCSTTYAPKPGPRIAVGLQGGAPVFFRDGQRFELGVLGGDVEEMVAGNPVAEEHARTYKFRVRSGLVCVLGGVVLAGGGMYLAAKGLDNRGDNGLPIAGLGLLGGALVLDVVGLVLLLTAQPHLWDAINIYNDGKAYTPAAARPSGTIFTF